MGSEANSSIEIPGAIRSVTATPVPFSDIAEALRFNVPSTGSTQNSISGDGIRQALRQMTASVRDDENNFRTNRLSAGAGNTYSNDSFGQDSITFGGLKR